MPLNNLTLAQMLDNILSAIKLSHTIFVLDSTCNTSHQINVRTLKGAYSIKLYSFGWHFVEFTFEPFFEGFLLENELPYTRHIRVFSYPREEEEYLKEHIKQCLIAVEDYSKINLPTVWWDFFGS